MFTLVKKFIKGRNLGESLVRGAIFRLATRSVPGAILVGGGLLAKTLHDRRKSRKSRARTASQKRDRQDDGEES